MQIYWHGFSSIRVETKTGDLEATLLTDPFEGEASVRFPRTITPDVLALSHQDRKRFNLEGAQGSPFMISDPGEYEVKGLFVQGIQDLLVDRGDVLRPLVYRIVAEGISVAFLGGMKRKLTEAEIEGLGNIDILILPVGGGDVMDAKTAQEMVTAIEPRLVIPIHFALPGSKAELADVSAFVKQAGIAKRTDATKLKVSRKDLPTEDMELVILERA